MWPCLKFNPLFYYIKAAFFLLNHFLTICQDYICNHEQTTIPWTKCSSTSLSSSYSSSRSSYSCSYFPSWATIFFTTYKTKIHWNSLFIQDNLKSFIDKLVASKKGPDGMANKLERLTIATNYTLREPKHSTYDTETGRSAKERIDAWKGSFQVKKKYPYHGEGSTQCSGTQRPLYAVALCTIMFLINLNACVQD